MKISKIIYSLFFLLVHNSVLADAANNLQCRLNQKNSFFAKFTQKIIDSHGNNLQKGYGNLWMKRPNLFNWHMICPNENIVVSNGKTLWIYNPYVKQVTIACLKDSIHGTPFMLLFSDLSKNWKHFSVKQKGDIFILKTRNYNSNIKKITINISQDGTIHCLDVTELNNQHINYSLKIQKNNIIDVSKFTFSLPKDVLIDDQRYH